MASTLATPGKCGMNRRFQLDEQLMKRACRHLSLGKTAKRKPTEWGERSVGYACRLAQETGHSSALALEAYQREMTAS
jgi:hypothetical protein